MTRQDYETKKIVDNRRRLVIRAAKARDELERLRGLLLAPVPGVEVNDTVEGQPFPDFVARIFAPGEPYLASFEQAARGFRTSWVRR